MSDKKNENNESMDSFLKPMTLDEFLGALCDAKRVQVRDNIYSLYRLITSTIDQAEKERLEFALTGMVLPQAARRAICKHVDAELMVHNMFVMSTRKAEIYAVAWPSGEIEGLSKQYHIGFALCMPEEMSLPKYVRRIRGFRIAKDRAQRSARKNDDAVLVLTVLPTEKLSSTLRERVIRHVLDALPYPNPTTALGMKAYDGQYMTARTNKLFFESGFPAQLVEKYEPILEKIDAARKQAEYEELREIEEQAQKYKEQNRPDMPGCACKPDGSQRELFDDGSAVALPPSEENDG